MLLFATFPSYQDLDLSLTRGTAALAWSDWSVGCEAPAGNLIGVHSGSSIETSIRGGYWPCPGKS